jgi:hypothetical protein
MRLRSPWRRASALRPPEARTVNEVFYTTHCRNVTSRRIPVPKVLRDKPHAAYGKLSKPMTQRLAMYHDCYSRNRASRE